MTQQVLDALGPPLGDGLDGECLSFELVSDGLALKVVVQDFGAGRLRLSNILK